MARHLIGNPLRLPAQADGSRVASSGRDSCGTDVSSSGSWFASLSYWPGLRSEPGDKHALQDFEPDDFVHLRGSPTRALAPEASIRTGA